MLDVAGLVGRPREHDGAGAAPARRGGGDQGGAQGVGVGPVAGHAEEPAVAGERPAHDRPGEQGLALAGGHVGEVAEHPGAALAVDHQVGTHDGRAGRRVGGERGPQHGGVAGHRLDGHDAGPQEAPLAVEVGHHRRQHLGPLGQAGGDGRPRGGVEHQGHDVEAPGAQHVLGAVVQQRRRRPGPASAGRRPAGAAPSRRARWRRRRRGCDPTPGAGLGAPARSW